MPRPEAAYLASIYHRSIHYIVHCVVNVWSSCQRGLNSSSRHALSAMYPGVKSVVWRISDAIPLVQILHVGQFEYQGVGQDDLAKLPALHIKIDGQFQWFFSNFKTFTVNFAFVAPGSSPWIHAWLRVWARPGYGVLIKLQPLKIIFS
jgi:hypothetical protein